MRSALKPILLRGVKAVAYSDLTGGSLPSWLSVSRAGNATQFDASGNLVYAANNLLLNTATLSTQTVSVVVNSAYILSFYGTGSVVVSGGATSTLNGTGAGNQVFVRLTTTTTSMTFTVSGSVTTAQLEQVTAAQTVPSAYNATAGSAYYGPRFDYDPSTLAAKGLLLEQARTNNVAYSSDATQAGWVKTSTTAAKDQAGIGGGANNASSLTATGSNATTLFATTQASSAQMFSAYIKRITGTGNIQMTMDGGTTWTTVTITSSWVRYKIPAQTVTNPSFGFRIVTNGDKIAFDMAQGEPLASTSQTASSPIPTYGSALTRAADVATISGSPATILASAQGTVLVETTQTTASTGGNSRILSNNSAGYTLANNGGGPLISSNGSSVLSTSGGTPPWATGMRAALAWNASGRSLAATNATLASDANQTAKATGDLAFTTAGGTLSGDGWYSKAAFYASRLPDATLANKVVMGAAL